MRTQRQFFTAALAALLLASGLALAADQTLKLMPDEAGKDASGTAVIRDKGAGQKELAITASGLKPDGIYTVWLVNMTPKMDMTGVGAGDYAFKADAQGRGSYTATVSAAELAKWQILEVAYHPDGKATNMKGIKIALKATLPK